ncbi:FtsK/SpoIIIE domain-containing protein [Bacillus sp. Marseille-P3800]|uniref:FtsK/SpoIIIE domain-containing protein n=1 Tax=Bacillus sp. Marseille-P3800 TaxID=2014782 RepID=UPI000C071B4E|nr:FtsK/SpoIIIE domain-containing protein [Bacillus sp. Marseille-P3800]
MSERTLFLEEIEKYNVIGDFLESNSINSSKLLFLKMIHSYGVKTFVQSPGRDSRSLTTTKIDYYPEILRRIHLEKHYIYTLNLNELNFLDDIVQYTTWLKNDELMTVKIEMQRDTSDWRSELLSKYERQSNYGVIQRNIKGFLGISNLDDISLGQLELKINTERFKLSIEIGFQNTEPERYEAILQDLESNLNRSAYYNSLKLSLKRPFSNQFYLTYDELSSIFAHDSANLIEDCPLTAQKELTEVEDVIVEDNQSKQATLIANSFDLLPLFTPEIEEDSQLEVKLKTALKSAQVVNNHQINVLDVKFGTLFNKIMIKIPSQLTFSQFSNKKANENIQAALGVKSLSVYQGDDPGSVSFFTPVTKRQPVYLSTIVKSEQFLDIQDSTPLPICIGVDLIGEPIIDCITKLTHLLVVGQTNGGKSQWFLQMITTLLLERSKDQMQMYLVDPKKVEFSSFAEFPQVLDVVTDMKSAAGLLQRLISEMDYRYEMFELQSCRNIGQYNRNNKPLPYIVVVIDEYANLTETVPHVNDYIRTLTEKARASGIHLVIGTQRPDAKIIDGVIKNNLPTKISFKLDNNTSYKTIFAEGIPTTLLGKGHGIMQREGAFGFEEFQGAIISTDEDETEDVIQNIKLHQSKSDKSDTLLNLDPSSSLEERIKIIIATIGETRVAHLQKILKVRTSKVNDALSDLVEQGWIKRGATKQEGYSIRASEDELQRHRIT